MALGVTVGVGNGAGLEVGNGNGNGNGVEVGNGGRAVVMAVAAVAAVNVLRNARNFTGLATLGNKSPIPGVGGGPAALMAQVRQFRARFAAIYGRD